MNERPLVVAQVNTRERHGGAEAIARALHAGYRRRGQDASLWVGRGTASGEDVHPFPRDRRSWIAHILAGPMRLVDRERGLETYRYPATRRLLDSWPEEPDVVHLHNLHGGYFDLRILPELSDRFPVVVTLHDAWLLSGHCAHSFDCERWRTGCGSCPDLTIYPAVRRDATAENWRRKRDIFRRSRLHVATPSAWLADRVRDSMLAAGVAELRVIPNGVDLRLFRPADRIAARSALGLDSEEHVLLLVGAGWRTNPFRDIEMARGAAAIAADVLGRDITVVVLGENGPGERAGRARFRFVPFREDAAEVARHYQAADLFVHAARADTFPTTVLEALACGTAVVATAVGGIPEQLGSAAGPPGDAARGIPPSGDAPGVLVAPGDVEAMGSAIAALLADAGRREAMAAAAARRATACYDAERQCDAYLGWYREILTGAGP